MVQYIRDWCVAHGIDPATTYPVDVLDDDGKSVFSQTSPEPLTAVFSYDYSA
jgi:hypothetical protein